MTNPVHPSASTNPDASAGRSQSPVPIDAKVTVPMAAMGALGIVFGDIGTSPLYTLKTVLDVTGAGSQQSILGVVSLLIWTLIIVTSVKYAGFAMRIDNDGEGGILALMALLGAKQMRRPIIVGIGLFGAALIYGDGTITPAISVLSALEGLNIVAPALQTYVLPATVAILVALFVVQPAGTARIGRAFGPVMALWFAVIALLGIGGIVHHPSVLKAINPIYGLSYLFHDGMKAFLVLGGVFLCVTGAEALYADMGHFGAKPIRAAWAFLVFPSLVLNYAGQGAIVLDGASIDGNIFYRLCPSALLVPLVILATIATIIASQSIITGAFSMTRQAIHLGWMPRLRVKQTSDEGYGQIYIGAVNWLLMIATISLALAFQKSDNLAGAYGIAVSATMLLTTVLLCLAMREIWHWGWPASLAVAALFFTVDVAFFTSNLAKLFDGGYVPLVLAALVFLVMYVWHRGVVAIHEWLDESPVTIEDFMAKVTSEKIARVSGTAVFLTRVKAHTPPVMMWYVSHSRALQEHVVAVTLETAAVPWLADGQRFQVKEAAKNFWFVHAHYGYLQRPDIPKLMQAVADHGCTIEPKNLTYFIGTEKIARRQQSRGVPGWIRVAFSALLRNSTRVTDYLNVPEDQLVDVGRQIPI